MNRTESGASTGGATPYRFDDVVVDPAAHSLLRGDVAQAVEPKAFAVLLALLQRPGELVGRDDLLDRVWGHRHVTPGVLTRAIAQLRHALDDDSQQPRYILTRHALGYSFIGQLQLAADIDAAPTTDGPGIGAPPSDGLAPAAQPAAAMSAPESAESPPQEPASPESAWHATAPGPTFGPVLERRRGHGRGLVLTLALIVVVVTWAVLHDATAPPPRVAASIAVMPFTTLSSDRSDDYFAEGLTEEMRDALAGVQGLKVAASIPAAGKPGAFDAKALGARLGVAAILDASVRREGSRLRITARLSDTATGFTLWSHTYDRELSDVFATQSEIAGEVVHALLGAIPGESEALAKRLTPTHSEAAFDTYLRGLQLLRHATRPDAADQAIAHFGQALKEDSGFARAQAGICRAETLRFQNQHSATAFDNARVACQRAAQMDPGLAEVNLALGNLYDTVGDPARALEHYRLSVKHARTPRMLVSAHVGMAQVYASGGKHDLAMQEFRQALALSPDDAFVHANIGYQQYLDGKPEQAVASYRRAVELAPDNADFWDTLGALYLTAGDNANAASALEHAIAIRPTASNLTDLGLLRHQAGKFDEAVELQRRATELNPEDYLPWGNLGYALWANPKPNTADAQKAFKEAATRAEGYLRAKPDDAHAVAALGFYRLMLGDRVRARELVTSSESLPNQTGEVALLNAETLALLGEIEPARRLIAIARANRVAETLISSNLTFRRLGLLSPPGTAGKGEDAEPPAPHKAAGRPTGA